MKKTQSPNEFIAELMLTVVGMGSTILLISVGIVDIFIYHNLKGKIFGSILIVLAILFLCKKSIREGFKEIYNNF